MVVYENVGLGFDVGDGMTNVGYCFIWWVGIWSGIQNLDDFPYIWTIWVCHCHLKEIFPAFCLGLVDSIGGFRASIDPFLLVLVGFPIGAILSTNFCLLVWSHPKFSFLAQFWFPCELLQQRYEYCWNEIYKEKSLVCQEDYPFLTQLC